MKAVIKEVPAGNSRSSSRNQFELYLVIEGWILNGKPKRQFIYWSFDRSKVEAICKANGFEITD